MSDRLVPITTVASRFEGEVVVARLRAEGIAGVLYADDAGGMAAPLARIEPVTVRVLDDDVEAARRILETTPDVLPREDDL